MRKKTIILSLVLVLAIGLAYNVYAQNEFIIPTWIKTAVGFWVNNQISDEEFLYAIEYFVENEMIHVPNAKKTTDDNLIQNLHILQTAINEKIRESRKLANNVQIQQAIADSNSAFSDISNTASLIQQLDSRWQSSDPDEPGSLAYILINNDAADVIRATIKADQESGNEFTYAEIFVTNAYGANVAQSGKTSDYRQDDERWWTEAKQNGIYLSESGYDESAKVYSSDIAVKILDRDNNFIGVLKAVIDVESLISNENR